MTAEDAYIAMGCPGNEAAATKQNIRKKARAMVAEARAEAGEPAAQSAKRGSAAPAKPAASKRKRGAPAPAPTPVPTKPAAKPAAKKLRKTYRTPHQVDVALANEQLIFDDYCARFKEATLVYAEYVSNGTAGTKGCSSRAVVDKYNEGLMEGGRELDYQRIRKAVNAGLAGQSPPRTRGPTTAIPTQMYKAMGTFAELNQAETKERSGKQLYTAMKKVVSGTKYAEFVEKPTQAKRHLFRVRAHSEVESLTQGKTEAARLDSCTYAQAEAYCESHEASLVKYGFADDTPVCAEDGSILEHVTILPAKRRRILNSDEKQVVISNVGDRGGSRTRRYASRRLPRPGKATSTVSKHVTMHAWSTAAGEVGPPHLNFASDAKDEDDRRIPIAAVTGLPEVVGTFGCREERRFPTTYNASSHGSTTDDNFLDFVEQNIVPCYADTLAPDWELADDGEVLQGPVWHRLDWGPGRLTLREPRQLARKLSLAARGYHLVGGLPRSSAMMQEQDVGYTEFQGSTDVVCDAIMEERREASEEDLTSGVGLRLTDIPRILNGRPEDEALSRMKPFEHSFQESRVLGMWESVGFVPATRKCLESSKISHADVDGDPLQVREQ